MTEASRHQFAPPGAPVEPTDAPPGPPGPLPPDTGGQAWPQAVAGALLLVVGVLWLLDFADAIDLRWRVLLPAGLIVVGVALVLVSLRHRAGVLMAVGVVLSVLVIATSLAPDRVSFSIGERTRQPATVAELEEHYSHGMGQLIVDLRQIEFDDDITVEANIGIGELVVRVPDGVALVIDATVGIGEATALDQSSSGLSVRLDESFPLADSPVLVLQLSAGIGQITVTR